MVDDELWSIYGTGTAIDDRLEAILSKLTAIDHRLVTVEQKRPPVVDTTELKDEKATGPSATEDILAKLTQLQEQVTAGTGTASPTDDLLAITEAGVPTATLEAARAKKLVDLREFAGIHQFREKTRHALTTDKGVAIFFEGGRRLRDFTSMADWITAFAAYTAICAAQDPLASPSLLTHQTEVARLEASRGLSVALRYRYDYLARVQAQHRQAWVGAPEATVLLRLLMTSDSSKVDRSETGQLGTGKGVRQPKKPSGGNGREEKKEICLRYNEGKAHKNCNRLHICNGPLCGSPSDTHPRSSCTRK
jgi:hypothetical protein